MSSLRELQLRFMAALFDEAEHPNAQLGIYRNNLREGFIKALGIGFPVIERLVGTAYFRQLALEFLHAYPSRSGNLHHIGEPLAPFLRQKFERTQHAYLADIAALEWAHQQALIAPDATPLSADAFQKFNAEDYEHLLLEFHPACGFVRSAFPIVRIWRVNQPGAPCDEVIDLASGSNNVLILRTPECVEFHSLPAARFALFHALSRGERLGAALESAQALEPDFDIAAALRHLLESRILVGLRLPESQD